MENKKEIAPEGSVQERPISMTIAISNMDEFEDLVKDIKNKLAELSNFKFKFTNK